MHDHKYIRLGKDANIIPLVMPTGPTVYRDLNIILEEEFSGASAGHLKDGSYREQEVLLFPNADDCSAFLLRYGHIYGKHK